MTAYTDFLKDKAVDDLPTGLTDDAILSDHLFDFQRDIVNWALRRGRAAIFADCGMGKTAMQLEWAKHVPGRVLIVAPLAVAGQTVREGEKFGVPCEYARKDADSNADIVITNYERLDAFDGSNYTGVVLDESSILKAFTGKIRNQVIEQFGRVPFRLACTATPAPNDYMELGNHAEFVGAMSRTEMLSHFFVHDGGETQKWRLKGHAESDFWKWLCSWAVMIRKPSDLGYSDDSFTLPPKQMYHHTVDADNHDTDMLFAMEARTLQERLAARRNTVGKRAEQVAALANSNDEPWLIWCNLNSESETVAKMIPGAVEVTGSMTPEAKTDAMNGFTAGDIRVLVTKPKIAGFGMNWQHCCNMAFLGLNDSWEAYYQAVRRCWRFGQKNEVNVHIVTADIEGAVVANIERKEKDAEAMAAFMVEHMSELNKENIQAQSGPMKTEYMQGFDNGKLWRANLGDCVEGVSQLESDSIGYTIFSPPFASLYTYSASDRDMGNCKNDDEFHKHFGYLIPELYRVTMPGRLLSFHCMNLPTSKARDGFIGIRDFRGKLIREFEEAGWIFHSEVCIWKDPVTAMQRTKALGLLHKQVCKDSAMSRQGIPDYLVTMRKPGDNPTPVEGPFDEFVGDQTTFQNTGNLSIDIWQRYASPVWMDVNPSRTLQKRSAREEKDERHICPLQLDVIERGLQLWSMPGDTVLSPFMGIGSEGYCAVKMKRKFVGFELKNSYWRQACKNLAQAELDAVDGDLFASVGIEA
jgi:superfamily II DNA or RNA helicase